VSILEGPPDKIDKGLRYLREEVQPAWETDPGFRGLSSSTTARVATRSR
jgi:hypothetical protein